MVRVPACLGNEKQCYSVTIAKNRQRLCRFSKESGQLCQVNTGQTWSTLAFAKWMRRKEGISRVSVRASAERFWTHKSSEAGRQCWLAVKGEKNAGLPPNHEGSWEVRKKLLSRGRSFLLSFLSFWGWGQIWSHYTALSCLELIM